MAGLSTSAARASEVSGPLRQYLPRQDGREEQQRGSGVIGPVRLEDPPCGMRARGPVDARDPSPGHIQRSRARPPECISTLHMIFQVMADPLDLSNY